MAAAWASAFEEPITKSSNVYLLLRFVSLSTPPNSNWLSGKTISFSSRFFLTFGMVLKEGEIIN